MRPKQCSCKWNVKTVNLFWCWFTNIFLRKSASRTIISTNKKIVFQKQPLIFNFPDMNRRPTIKSYCLVCPQPGSVLFLCLTTQPDPWWNGQRAEILTRNQVYHRTWASWAASLRPGSHLRPPGTTARTTQGTSRARSAQRQTQGHAPAHWTVSPPHCLHAFRCEAALTQQDRHGPCSYELHRLCTSVRLLQFLGMTEWDYHHL